MVNKLLSLGENDISQLKEIANTLGLSESTTVKIAIAILYNKVKVDVKNINDLLKND